MRFLVMMRDEMPVYHQHNKMTREQKTKNLGPNEDLKAFYRCELASNPWLASNI